MRRWLARRDRRGQGEAYFLELMAVTAVLLLMVPWATDMFGRVQDYREETAEISAGSSRSSALSTEFAAFARALINVPRCANPPADDSYDDCVTLAEPPKELLALAHSDLPSAGITYASTPSTAGADETLGCFLARAAALDAGIEEERRRGLRCLVWSSPRPLGNPAGNRNRGADDPPASRDHAGTLQSVLFPLAPGNSALDPEFVIPAITDWSDNDDIQRVVMNDVAGVGVVYFSGDGEPILHSELKDSVVCLPLHDIPMTTTCASPTIAGLAVRRSPTPFPLSVFDDIDDTMRAYFEDRGIRRATIIICPATTADLDGNKRGDCLDALELLGSALIIGPASDVLGSEALGFRYIDYRFELIF